MQIGVDLGWSGVRAVIVTARGEILSVPDSQDPKIVETLPVVAWTSGGALVGRPALALAQENIPGLFNGTPKHAFAEAARGNSEPLTILLAKLARDFSDYGARADEAFFCVHDEILSMDRDAVGRNAFETAVYAAGFQQVRYTRRARAAAMYMARQASKDGFLPSAPRASLQEKHPATLTIDTGFRALRVSSMYPPVFGAVSTTFQEVAATGWLPAVDDLLVDCYGHFSDVIARNAAFPEKGWRDAFTLDTLWTLISDPKAPDFVTVLDAHRRPQLFDVVSCRKTIAEDVSLHLREAIERAERNWISPSLSMFREGRIDGPIICLGEYASIPYVHEAVEALMNELLRKGSRFQVSSPLPSNALATAVALVVPDTCVETALPSDRHDIVRDRGKWRFEMPINDGEFAVDDIDHVPEGGKKHDARAIVVDGSIDPIDLLDADLAAESLGGALSSAPDRVTRDLKSFSGLDVGAVGRLLGSLWAVQIDRLQRLIATAPTVQLKRLYASKLNACGVESEDIDPLVILDKLQTRSEIEPLQKRIMDRDFQSISAVDGWSVFSKSFCSAFAVLQLDHAAGTPFAIYAQRHRSESVPSGKALALAYSMGGDYPSRLPERGLTLSDRLLVSQQEDRTDDPPLMRPEQMLGVSSDGFRPMLATSFLKRYSIGAFQSFLSDLKMFAGGRGPWSALSWGALIAFVLVAFTASFPQLSTPFHDWRQTAYPLLEPTALPLTCTNEGAPQSAVCKSGNDVMLSVAPSPAAKECYVAILRVVSGVTKFVEPQPSVNKNEYLSRAKNLPYRNHRNTTCALGNDLLLPLPVSDDAQYSVEVSRQPAKVDEIAKSLDEYDKATFENNTFARNIIVKKRGGDQRGQGVVIQELVWSGWDPSTIRSNINRGQVVFRGRDAVVQHIRDKCIDDYSYFAVIRFDSSAIGEAKAAIVRQLERPVVADANNRSRWLLREAPPPPAPGQQPPKLPSPVRAEELTPPMIGAGNEDPLISVVVQPEQRFLGSCRLAS